MRNTLNVLKFEFKGFVGSKAYQVVTIIFVAGIIIALCLPQIISKVQERRGEDAGGFMQEKAAVILSGEALTNELYLKAFTPEALNAANGARWEDLSRTTPPLSDEALGEAIRNGDYNLVLRYSGGTACEFLVGNRISTLAAIYPIEAYITDIVKQAETSKLPPETQEAVTRIDSISVDSQYIEIGGNAENNVFVGYILIMFLMYTIIMYISFISNAVVTEKTSKAMELLITAVKPLHLMVGKVLGVGLAALAQVVAFIAAAAIGIAINLPFWLKTGGFLLGVVEGENVGPAIAIMVVLYFFLGFFLYAFLAAAFASTVTRPEEAASVNTLPALLMLASLFIGFLTLFGVLGKGVSAVFSYIPFFTPIVMVSRYTVGDVGIGYLLIGAIILAAAVVIIAYLAAKIFRMGVMLYGVKATPKQLWRALKSS